MEKSLGATWGCREKVAPCLEKAGKSGTIFGGGTSSDFEALSIGLYCTECYLLTDVLTEFS